MADEILSLVSALTLLLSLVFLCMMAAILGFGIFVLRNVSTFLCFVISVLLYSIKSSKDPGVLHYTNSGSMCVGGGGGEVLFRA